MVINDNFGIIYATVNRCAKRLDALGCVSAACCKGAL